MLILLPVILLLGAAPAILLIHWLRPNFKYCWTLAAISALASWLGAVALRFWLGNNLVLSTWQPRALFPASPALILDYSTWPYALAITGLVLSVILTATARAQYNSIPAAWAASLLLGGLGLLSVMAANPVTLVMSWAALDLAELVLLLGNVATRELSQRSVLGYIARTAGTFFVLWAAVAGSAQGEVQGFGAISPQVGIFLLVGAGLRLGVLPLHLPFTTEPPMRRGLGTLLRLIPAASALAVLGRLPGDVAPVAWQPAMLWLSAFAGLYGAAMWLASSDEIGGRPYWIIALAALGVISAIRHDPTGSISWGLALLLTGGVLFLYSARERRLGLVWLLGLWGISGLPYSPGVSGWKGLWIGPLPGLDLVFILTVALLIAGYTQHALKAGDPLFSMERWIQTTYTLGLLILPVTQLLVAFSAWMHAFEIGIWWAGGVLACLTAAGVLILIQRQAALEHFRLLGPLQTLVVSLVQRLLDGLAYFFSLEWLYRLFWIGFRGVNWSIATLTAILEGDGGVLWALVLLALIASLFAVGGRP